MKKKLSVSIIFLLSLSLLSSLAAADAWVDKYTVMLRGSMVRTIEGYANGFDLTRSPGIQAELLDEHIEWANLSSEPDERALCVALALHIVKRKAQKELANEDIEVERQVKVRRFLSKVPAAFEKYKKLSNGISDKNVKGISFIP